jgi:hypothetical protein
MKLDRISITLVFLSALLILGCASEAPPGGGPPDRTPPILIDINVASGSTLVPEDQEILFYFSETINPDNISKSVTVFPLSDKSAIVRAKGRSLSVKPADIWDKNTVYTLIIGKGVSDIRGNNLDQPIQMSFTSGDHIPENRIIGKVLGLKENTTAVISLSRKTDNPDSILLFPEYYTQTGPEGDFSFEYLPSEVFHIAGYVDMDKSNSYKDKFDGVCIPLKPTILPDTVFTPLMMQAVYENYLTGFVINAESLDPCKTEITFSKDLADWNHKNNFQIISSEIDTLTINERVCRIYHSVIDVDTFSLSLRDLRDKVGLPLADSTLFIPVKSWPDSFFHFEQMDHYLRITPDPGADKITAEFRSSVDTSEISLLRRLPGFYRIPQFKTGRNGTCLLTPPFVNKETVSDSLYSFDLKIPAAPEYGAVLGRLDAVVPARYRLILSNDKNRYDIAVKEFDFKFEQVLPGSYALSYYIDENHNGRRDIGRPYPHVKPEFLLPLDSGIDVRARWDTELAEPYKIVVENGK